MINNHTDDSNWVTDGVHTAGPYIEAWTPIHQAHPDVLLYPTMASGGPAITVETRWSHQGELARAGLAGMGAVDPGSVGFGQLDDAGLPAASDLVYQNTFAHARYMFERCAELGLGPSISIYDPSFLRVALAFHEARALPPGALIKLYFGGQLLFGLPATTASLECYLAMLDGSGLPWLVAVLGGDIIGCGLAAAALERGGHVRVGLEDYAGPRTPSNLQLVEALAALVTQAGRRVATAAETRRLLGIQPHH